MDPNSGKIFPYDAVSPSDRKRLVEIPKDDDSAVKGMNRPQRRAWGTVMRQTQSPKLAYEAARKKGWAGREPAPASV